MATRDAMAKCLYGALFDWIVLQLNYSLLSKRDDREHKVGRASKATSQFALVLKFCKRPFKPIWCHGPAYISELKNPRL